MAGGKRPGSGRKKGKKNPETLEREKVLAEVRQRILRSAQRFLDAQSSVALGQQFLYKIVKKKKVGPKGGISYEAQKPELVTSEIEIRSYLEGLVENGDMEDNKDPAATYYFITTKEPSNNAIDSLMNRAFGKTAQAVELAGKDGGPIQIEGVEITVRK